MNTASNGNSGIGQFEVDGEDTIFQPADEFVGTGSMDNVAFPTSARPTNYRIQSQSQHQGDSRLGWLPQWLSCLNFGSFQSYFDVDTEDVKDRVIGSVIYANSADHFVNEVLRKPGKSADLYGPVWITMTCVFLFAVTSNTSKYLHTESLTDFEYDISHLTHAFYIFSFYTFVIPLLLFLILKAISVPLSLVELISLYGYSLVPYIPITILCLLPSVILEWIFLLSASILSLLFVLRNIGGPLVRTSRAWGGPIMMAVMGCHLVFYFVLKWSFYRHRYHEAKGGDQSDNGLDNMDDALDDTINGSGSERW